MDLNEQSEMAENIRYELGKAQDLAKELKSLFEDIDHYSIEVFDRLQLAVELARSLPKIDEG